MPSASYEKQPLETLSIKDLRKLGPLISDILYQGRTAPPTNVEKVVFWALAESIFAHLPNLGVPSPLTVSTDRQGAVVKVENEKDGFSYSLRVEKLNPKVVADRYRSRRNFNVDDFVNISFEENTATVVLYSEMSRDDASQKFEVSSDRPRWAEEKRGKKQVKLRLPENLIHAVDANAESLGIDRNAWITLAIHQSLKP